MKKVITFILISITFINVSFSQICGDSSNPYNDNNYLYQNGSEIDVDIFTNIGGHQTFEVTRLADGKKLIESFGYENFYSLPGGTNVNVTYQIIEICGGVDINYTVTNTSGSPQRLPFFIVRGLKWSAPENLYSLNGINHSGYIVKRDTAETHFSLYNRYPCGRYPAHYAPVIVAHDSDFTVGSSLNYSILDKKHMTVMDIYYSEAGVDSSTYRLVFSPRQKERDQSEIFYMADGETYNYTVPVRFSNPRNWITTLHSYKTFFTSLYGAGQTITPRDNNPLYGVVFSSSPSIATSQSGNTRGYSKRVDLDGVGAHIIPIIDTMQAYGYSRSMLWNIAGNYDELGQGLNQWDINYPPQFMGDLLPMVDSTISDLALFTDDNISIGFWWGRAAQIPTVLAWDPPAVVPFEVANSVHTNFARNELIIARDLNATDIGLDAFGYMEPADRMMWIDSLETIAPTVKFTAEGGYTPTDFVHSKIGIFVWPHNWVTGPNVLADYLNPEAEVQLYFSASRPDNPTFDHFQDIVRWGWTPLINEHIRVDISNIDLTVCECFDGIDNDGDGLIDYPYDPNCDSASQLSEGVLSVPTTNLANSIVLFPNPTNSKLHIQSNSAIKSIYLISVNGKQTNIPFANQTIDISNLSAGIYFLKIETEAGIVTKKVIKQ